MIRWTDGEFLGVGTGLPRLLIFSFVVPSTFEVCLCGQLLNIERQVVQLHFIALVINT